jgi:hypothetical protein
MCFKTPAGFLIGKPGFFIARYNKPIGPALYFNKYNQNPLHEEILHTHK